MSQIGKQIQTLRELADDDDLDIIEPATLRQCLREAADTIEKLYHESILRSAGEKRKLTRKRRQNENT